MAVSELISGGTSWFLLVMVASFFVAVAAVISAARLPETAFRAAGSNKVLWIIVPIVLTFIFVVGGGIAGLVFLLGVRPRVQDAALRP